MFTKIGIAGDWHVVIEFAERAIKMLHEAGVKHILHVGDFGFYNDPAGLNYLQFVQDLIHTNDQMIYVTLGNHENYSFVNSFVKSEIEGFTYHPDYPNILVADRGTRWVWNDVSFVSLGGANSINRDSLIREISWWEDEQISLGDVYRTVQDGHADVMITHDVPIGVNIHGNKDTDEWSMSQKAYASKSREALRQVTDTIKPGILFHGHHHVRLDTETIMNDGIEDYVLRSVCMNMNDQPGNVGIFSTTDQTFEFMD